MAMYSETGFVMIPENNDALWSKDPRFSLNHAYILERVRSFSNHNLPCFISNSRFARELHASESTVTRAIKLLVEKNVLWASYNQESETNKQRVLWVYDEQKATHGDKKSQKQDNAPASKSPKFGLSVSQNEDILSSVCLPARFKMTASDSQNGALIHKNTLKTDKLVDKNIIDNTFYVENKGLDSTYDTDYTSQEKEWDYDIECGLATIADAPDWYKEKKLADMHNEAPVDLEDYFSLTPEKQEEIIDDSYMGILEDDEIPHWAQLYIEIYADEENKADYDLIYSGGDMSYDDYVREQLELQLKKVS